MMPCSRLNLTLAIVVVTPATVRSIFTRGSLVGNVTFELPSPSVKVETVNGESGPSPCTVTANWTEVPRLTVSGVMISWTVFMRPKVPSALATRSVRVRD